MDFKKEERKASFRVFGDRRLTCWMRIIPIGKKALPDVQVESKLDGQIEKLKSRQTEEGHLEYDLFGEHVVTVSWSAGRSSTARLIKK